MALVPSGLLARVFVWGVPFLLQDEHGDVGALPAPRGLPEEQEGMILCFGACCYLVVTLLGVTVRAMVPLGLAKL